MNKTIQRNRIEDFERKFETLHASSCHLLDGFPKDRLFTRVALNGDSISFGIELIRSAAEIEKAFGGITTRLWDDPFEWTLPEELSSKSRIAEYINEVKTARVNGFKFLKDDEDLNRLIPAPEKLQSIADIFRRTIELSEYHLQRAALPANSLR